MPCPHRLPRPEDLAQIPPRDPGPVPVGDRLDNRPGIGKLTTRPARRTREHLLDQRPLSIREQVSFSTEHPNLCQTRPNPA